MAAEIQITLDRDSQLFAAAELSEALTKMALRHVFIGGFALAALGSTRRATDIDIVAQPTQGTWRSNDYVSAVRLMDAWLFYGAGRGAVYIHIGWLTQTCATTLVISSRHHNPNIKFPKLNLWATYVPTDIMIDIKPEQILEYLRPQLAVRNLYFAESGLKF